MTSERLVALQAAGSARSVRDVVDGLHLRERHPSGRPRVVAAMIASVDGRVAVQGRSVALGHPADRALLRELRTGVDALLVGAATLRAERYANLLDDEQRLRRQGEGLDPAPLVATVSRDLDVALDVPLFSEPSARIRVYSERDGELRGRGASVTVRALPRGALTLAAVLEDLHARERVRAVLCEGGPTLLRALIAEGLLDDLFLTISPLLIGGEALTALGGDRLEPIPRLALHDVHRADDHLVLHYVL